MQHIKVADMRLGSVAYEVGLSQPHACSMRILNCRMHDQYFWARYQATMLLTPSYGAGRGANDFPACFWHLAIPAIQ